MARSKIFSGASIWWSEKELNYWGGIWSRPNLDRIRAAGKKFPAVFWWWLYQKRISRYNGTRDFTEIEGACDAKK
jgi:hypothetical protein